MRTPWVQQMSNAMEECSGISREDLLKLMEEKDRVEAEIAQLVGVLENNNNVGMHEPLVDADGFPRNDIDVYQVRHTRHAIICRQNDHKNLMAKIERGLHAIHAQFKEGDAPNADESVMEICGDPFVRVNLVSPGSPAETAGLQVDDQFVEFGTLNSRNFSSLQDVAKIVQHSVNSEIPLTVKRNGKRLQLRLVPKTWSGRGLLGCNIIPLENVER